MTRKTTVESRCRSHSPAPNPKNQSGASNEAKLEKAAARWGPSASPIEDRSSPKRKARMMTA